MQRLARAIKPNKYYLQTKANTCLTLVGLLVVVLSFAWIVCFRISLSGSWIV